MKQFFLVFFLFFSMATGAQEIYTEIRGNISVPEGADPEGITIYNKSSSRGTVSSREGDFLIEVRAGDTLYFSAVQFKEAFMEITSEIVKTGVLNISITEGLNELPEVVLRPHELSGNLNVDAENIKVVDIPLPPLSISLNEYDYEMRPDSHSRVQNAATGGGGMKNGMNIGGILSRVVQMVKPDQKKVSSKPPMHLIEFNQKLRSRYTQEFFADVLKIPVNQVSSFIAFLYKREFPEVLFAEKKEMDLLQHLMDQAELFRSELSKESAG